MNYTMHYSLNPVVRVKLAAAVYRIERVFNRGRLFSAMMGVFMLLAGKTPRCKFYVTQKEDRSMAVFPIQGVCAHCGQPVRHVYPWWIGNPKRGGRPLHDECARSYGIFSN